MATYTYILGGAHVVAHCNANDTIQMANLVSGTESVSSARLNAVEWGVANGGYITITRGSSSANVVSQVFTGSGKIENMRYAAANTLNEQSNIYVTFTNGSGFIAMYLTKNIV